MKKFQMSPIDMVCDVDFCIIDAENMQEAYYLFMEDCLGIRLSSYQKEEVMKSIVAGNPIFDFVACDEVLP